MTLPTSRRCSVPKSQLSPTTGASRRHGPVAEGLEFASRFVGGPIKPKAAVAAVPPRPHGELSVASIAHIGGLAATLWEDAGKSTRGQRAQATRCVLKYLLDFPGQTWQERWDASPIGQGLVGANTLGTRRTTGMAIPPGVRALYCLRVIQPSLLTFRRNVLHNFAPMFVAAQDDPLLHKYAAQVQAHPLRHIHRREALSEMCTLLAVQGVRLSDVTPAAVLHFTQENRRARSALQPGNTVANRLVGQGMWNVLHAMGHFPPSTPVTLRAALMRGQRTVEELVDQYPIRNRSVRGLLIDYFTRRRVDTDYSTLKQLVLLVAHHFWERIERVNPEQADLRISPEHYAAWRQTIMVKDNGKPRAGQDSIIIAVRSFYYDLHTWAAEEPERWAAWVAPCPVPPSELHGLGTRRRRINERSANRTRQRQPLLPVLVEHVEMRYDHARLLLDRANKASDGELFTHDGTEYRRVTTESDRKLLRHGDAVPTRVIEEATGQINHIGTEEEAAFWEWAMVETLRHSGVRVEELVELTHLSVRQYQRANGEVIALLVVAPSKTDRERVIPMSAELFHVIASIIRRHTRTGRPIPLVSRYDSHDKEWSAPMPFLFQRQNGTTPAVFSTAAVQEMIGRRGQALAEVHPGFRGLKFTPHDFRRIFATELVNSGLPIHIGAALLGHLSIQTTRGYVAVFDEDVVRHYQEHLHRRRNVRPEGEYRNATDQEWAEFDEHFDRRKVELGSCGRPYGTPCQHEHACIRCPMLRINPKMLARLEELEADLLARLRRAEEENWLGEVEGINLTLTFLQAKREETERQARRPSVSLGIPKLRRAK
ncbi:tyrosine-type recombinase/integrase [Streptomyces sp. NBC_00273]|uniref:tyrosine-type recombinase/integrase n=1 Tax=Streptomyces sp. NBC_00273 TaxID=2903644 RepID=UPI002E2C859D|nr:site-specific integrase [Streptomyces sp. NBC_00273]